MPFLSPKALAIYSWTLGADALYINSAGNVGISTTSPSGKLHVVERRCSMSTDDLNY